MRSIYYITFSLLICAVTSEEKLAKHFSLFSVVTFGNEECTSGTSISGGATAGTCYSSTECSDKKGMASGNCASGFGVCCVFLNTAAASATITENRTRLRNTEYPSIATATTAQSIVYTVSKMKDDICQIRLDFDSFIIAGPSVSTEAIAAGGQLCQDSLRLATTDVPNTATLPQGPSGILCGALTGQHLYVDLSPTTSDALTMTLGTVVSTTITPAIAARVWDIKVSQIECHATYRAPAGCQQYYMARSGKISSMNFMKVTGSTPAAAGQNSGVHLATSHIRSCIRREKHMCCTEYQLCTSFNGIALADITLSGAAIANNGAGGLYNDAWSIDMDTTPFVIDTQNNIGMADNQCTGDYVEIPSSMSRTCGAMFGSGLGTMNTRYCGAKFGTNMQQTAAASTGSSSVCDCSEPFVVTANFDDLSDGGAIATANINQQGRAPRGFCLDFKQTPCYN